MTESTPNDLFLQRALSDAVGPEPLADHEIERLEVPVTGPADEVKLQRIADGTRQLLDARRIQSDRLNPKRDQSPAARSSHQPHNRLASNNPRGAVTALAIAVLSLLAVLAVTYRASLDDERTAQSGRELLQEELDSIQSDWLTPQRQENTEVVVSAVGDRIITGAHEMQRLQLPDGSTLFVNEETEAVIETSRRVRVTRGEVFVEVVPQFDEQTGRRRKQFQVVTPTRTVTALGTKFGVVARPRDNEVLVTQGKVRVSGFENVLTAGQQLQAEAQLVAMRPAMRASEHLNWTRELITDATTPIIPRSKHAGGSIISIDPSGQEMKLSLREYHIDVHIEDGFARTTIDQTYFNHTHSRLEGTFHFPLPSDASLSRLAMYVNGKLMEGGMTEREHARNTFEKIVAKMKDPALLEWVDGSTFKMRVFPLEPRQEKRIVLSYTQRLDSAYGKTQYRFPAGHTMDGVKEWSVRMMLAKQAEHRWKCRTHKLNESADGDDLILTGEKQNSVLDRDLVLEIGESDNDRPVDGRTNWLINEYQGQKYLMLRHRPELTGKLKREPRHWVFLFETSADRNPILARTQIEVVRQLLDNAEHTDTFNIVTAGPRATQLFDEPMLCTRRNARAAVRQLQKVHLIGALDLDKGLQTAVKAARNDRESMLVHTGSAIPVLGRHDQGQLLNLLKDKVTYVGIGIGKRWSRPLMKEAAGRTGGYFTQINPDDDVSWRAFEVSSILNAPRLLNLTVTAKGEQQDRLSESAFLTFADTIVQGEELCAVMRVPANSELPDSIQVTGLLNGKEWSTTLKVKPSEDSADYLPRTWAKLRIDRLLADSRFEHKDEIVRLSMSMYVMSPFTSLLVLENEEMYQRFNVDRGRDDHWALYDCPQSIKVVQEPVTTNTITVDNQQFELPKDVLSIRVIDTPGFIQRSFSVTPDIQNQMHAQLQQQLTREDQPAGGYPANAQVTAELLESFNFNSLIEERRYHDARVTAGLARLYAGGQPITELMFEKARALKVEVGHIEMLKELEKMTDSDKAVTRSMLTLRLPATSFPNPVMKSTRSVTDTPVTPFAVAQTDELNTLILNRRPEDVAAIRRVLQAEQESLNRQLADVQLNLSAPDERSSVSGRLSFNQPNTYMFGDRLQLPGSERLAFELLSRQTNQQQRQGRFYAMDERMIASGPIRGGLSAWFKGGFGGGDAFVGDAVPPLDWAGAPILDQWSPGLMGLSGPGRSASDVFGIDAYGAYRDFLRQENVFGRTLRPNISQAERQIGRNLDPGISNPEMASGMMPGPNQPAGFSIQLPVLGIEPTLHFGQDARFFGDLLAHAPGLNTSPADLLAAQKDKDIPRGKVDKAARQLIEKARSAGWEKITFGDRDDSGLTLFCDGRGRHAWERTVSEGLREEVYCDGQTLQHLYREIGLGSTRTFSRFHHQALKMIVPWLLPSAEDLSIGSDIHLVNKSTVSISRMAQEKETDDKAQDVEIHLLFASDGPIRQLRLVAGEEILQRYEFSAKGPIRVFNKDNEKILELKLQRTACDAPAKPRDPESLVMLPMPVRSLKSQLKDSDAPTDANDPWGAYSEQELLSVILAALAENDGHTCARIVWEGFLRKGDERVGFYVLVSRFPGSLTWTEDVVGTDGQRRTVDLQPEADRSKLHQFLRQYIRWQQQDINTRRDFDLNDEGESNFVSSMARAANIYTRWASGRAVQDRSRDQIRDELHASLRFVANCRTPALGWGIISVIQPRLAVKKFQGMLAESAEKFEDDQQLSWIVRRERIRMLFAAGEAQRGRRLYGQLLRNVATAGLLPHISSQLRRGYRSEGGEQKWNDLMQQLSERLMEDGQIRNALLLSIQLRQFGDNQVAGEILDDVLSHLEATHQPYTALLAVEQLRQLKDVRSVDILSDLMTVDYLREASWLWRYAADVADASGRKQQALLYTERAVNHEYENRPDMINVAAVRSDYENLMLRYEQVVDALQTLEENIPADLAARIIRAADQWRSLEDDPTACCHRTAMLLGKIGQRDAQWDYLTTPIAGHAGESPPWQTLARHLVSTSDFERAEMAWKKAFEFEQTNPDILLSHARMLQSMGRMKDSRPLLEQIVNGQWQPKYNNARNNARNLLQQTP